MNIYLAKVHAFFCRMFRPSSESQRVDKEVERMKKQVEKATKELNKKLTYIEQLLEELKSKGVSK